MVRSGDGTAGLGRERTMVFNSVRFVQDHSMELDPVQDWKSVSRVMYTVGP